MISSSVTPTPPNQRHPNARRTPRSSAVALTDVAHCPDTIILFSALLAESDLVARFSISIAYLVLMIGWCSLGFFLLRHPCVRGPAQRYGNHLSPYLLIGVGIYILLNTIHDLASP